MKTLLTSLLLPTILLTACNSVDAPEEISIRKPAPAGVARAVAEYNLDDGVAIDGYDPVSYFEEGGSAPVAGNPALAIEYGGVIYFFANEANRETFLANPARFEPAHGGQCSYAVAKGGSADIDPETYILRDGRLFLFYNDGGTNTKELLVQEGADQLLRDADEVWRNRTGEEPRM